MTNKSYKEIILENISNRKSVRSFIHGKNLSKEEFVTLVKAGMAAPTSKNSQPWNFIAINEEEKLREIAKAAHFAEMMVDAGSAIILVAETLKADKADPNVWIQDMAAASQNILLAAEAMGLGACWCQIYNIEERVKIMQEVLELPEQVMPFNILCIGHPAGFDHKQDKWNPKKLFWNKWTNTV